ncbi:MAG: alkaline phosphatase family protein [Chitinophagaceae bacterium]|nr:alkaline phosphatase family protein [Chitinophagaceae bacterium]
MLRNSFLLFTFYFFTAAVFAQTPTQGPKGKPKLVVGLVVDQMRWDYLYRYSALYGEGGFKRMLKEGFSSENNFIPFVPTYTAVGHTCIYTGSVPALTGIVGNNWFDKTTGKGVYCTDDSTVSTIGNNGKAGKMSPANMWVTTITDELRLSNNFKSKVIGIALKDRGAILPAGHSANAAYWYDAGKWISSSHYMNTLPTWVEQFNAKDLPAKYMSKDWTTLLPMDKYDLSTADDKPYESPIRGEKTVTFPHKLSLISDNDKYEAFRTTPFANTYTFDFAKAAIENEALGKNTVTDFLAISISSTDYVGHNFGPNSVEVEDMYLRLDKDVADFLMYLDSKLGKGSYTVFLSADHAVAHIPAFLAEHKIPGGNFEDGDIRKELNQMIETDFGVKNVVQSLQNYQVYLNINELEMQGKDVAAVKKTVIKILQAKPFIITAFETDKLAATTLSEPQKTMLSNGYNTKRSGDIHFTLKAGYFDGGKKGTTHGAWNPYDAHIPCVFFGWGVKPGKTYRETYMTDIAPTLAAMLQIQMPNGSVGKVISELVK